MWYSAVGCLTVVVVGLIVSGVTGFQDPKKLNPDLICNVGDTLYWFMPKKVREFLRFKVGDNYVSIFIHSPKKNTHSFLCTRVTDERRRAGGHATRPPQRPGQRSVPQRRIGRKESQLVSDASVTIAQKHNQNPITFNGTFMFDSFCMKFI